jgi:predicted 3-demethylubiquinone-9 3-methyltransferase (glyoxalase superfamily)
MQVIPKELGGLLQHPDKEIREKAMRAMLQMKKIEVAKLTA